MLTLPELANAIRAVTKAWLSGTSPADSPRSLDNPTALGARLAAEARRHLQEQGYGMAAGVEQAWTSACLHLPNVFSTTALPVTPTSFGPVPDVEETLLARAAAITLHALLDLETVSYGSENDGQLFVNLVTIPGTGIYAKKSTKGMKGHTDAVSFPVRGQSDRVAPSLTSGREMAPSPDFVSLAVLRNPGMVPTTVMPLNEVLAKLDPAHIVELKKPQFIIRSQATFQEGMRRILKDVHVVDGGALLFDVGEQTWARFSHSNILVESEEGPAQDALLAFQQACRASEAGIVTAPGDILLVNNRLALHGRATVGTDVGGESRWLLRTYGLCTDMLSQTQRYSAPPFMLFP